MKHLKLATICLGLALTVMVVTEADAAWFKKSTKGSRTEKTEEEMKPQRFDNLPSMQFLGGVLTREAHSGWKIGNVPLYLHKDCVITMDGEDEGWLEEGREAIVMGSRVGSAISAWSIHIAQPAYMTMGSSQSEELKEPGPNPSVGLILRPVE